MSRTSSESTSQSRESDSTTLSGTKTRTAVSNGSHGHTEALELTVPVPPSTNGAYLNSYGGKYGRKLTPRGRAYKADVLHLANAAGVQRMSIEPPYALMMLFYFPDNKRRDASNFVKIAEDALMEAIGGDDTDVTQLLLQKRIDRSNPRVEVRLRTHDSVSANAEESA